MQTLSTRDLLARLIAFDTTSARSNLPLVDFLCDYLDRPGVVIERHPSPDGTKANLVVRLGPEPAGDGRGLVLSAHMDVVPAGDGWASDPFHLSEREVLGEPCWFGRGTADMKGFLALAVNAAAAASAGALRQPLLLILTYDEELGCLGARHLAETWPADRPLPRAALIGEPTSLAAVSLHKGHLKLALTVHGTSAHSGYPHLGHNAIEPIGRAILALTELRQALAAERPAWNEHFPETPFVALNLGTIGGGTAINVVPERCRLELGLRPLPDGSSADLQHRVAAALRPALDGERYELTVISDSPPLRLSPDAAIYRAVTAWNDQRAIVAASYATDAGWLQRLGLDCLVCGPGTIEVAHKPDEHVPVAEIERGRELVAHLVEHFCRVEAP